MHLYFKRSILFFDWLRLPFLQYNDLPEKPARRFDKTTVLLLQTAPCTTIYELYTAAGCNSAGLLPCFEIRLSWHTKPNRRRRLSTLVLPVGD